MELRVPTTTLKILNKMFKKNNKLGSILKVFSLMLGLVFTVSCSTTIPDPFHTGSIYRGTIDSRHVGLAIIFPWATKQSVTSTTEGD